MRNRDFILLGVLFLVLLALTAPAWLSPGRALWNFGDLYVYHYPLRHLAVSSLEAGRLPFWNPYIFGGLPLAANPQAVLFYPVSILGSLLPLTLAFSWDYLFHLAWGALGTALLGRANGLAPWAAAALAAMVSLSPFLIYRVTEGIPTLLASLSWTPWCWLALQSGRPGFLAGVWAMQFLSGHPQFMVLNALGMALWAATRPRNLLRMALEGAGVFALACVQWPATSEFLRHSVRKSWSAVFTTAYSISWRELATWVHPDAWGNPVAGTYGDVPSVFFETSGVFVSIAGLALAVLGIWKGKRTLPLVLAGAGLFLAAGGRNPLYRAALAATPLGFLRTPSRALLLVLWGLIVAAGSGSKALVRVPAAAKALVLTLLVLELAHWDARFLRAEDAAPYLAAKPAVAEAVGGRPFRVLTDPELANPNKTILYRAMNVNGYEAFYLGTFPAYAARSEGTAAADPSRSYLRRPETPEMRRAGVAVHIGPSGALRPVDGALPLAYFQDWRGALKPGVRVEVERPELWRVRGSAPSGAERLVLAQPFYPGWKAWLGGIPVSLEPWDGFWQAVDLRRVLPGGGEFELDFRFEPSGWAGWALLGAFSWLAWFAFMARGAAAW